MTEDKKLCICTWAASTLTDPSPLCDYEDHRAAAEAKAEANDEE